MSAEPETKDAPLTQFKLEIGLDATLSIKVGQDYNWVKPHVTGSMSWSALPTDRQLLDSVDAITKQLVEPLMDEIIQASSERLKELHV